MPEALAGLLSLIARVREGPRGSWFAQGPGLLDDPLIGGPIVDEATDLLDLADVHVSSESLGERGTSVILEDICQQVDDEARSRLHSDSTRITRRIHLHNIDSNDAHTTGQSTQCIAHVDV